MAMEKIKPGAARLFNANTSKEEASLIMTALLDKKSPLKLLYVTPEKLAKSKRFMSKLQASYKFKLPNCPIMFTNYIIILVIRRATRPGSSPAWRSTRCTAAASGATTFVRTTSSSAS